MVRAYLLPLATLLLASHLLAQDFPAPPVAPQNSHDEITNAFAATALMPPRPAVADKSFWRWNAPSLAINAADLAQTAHCLVAEECVEQNPLLGANPSMTRLFGTSLPIFAAQLGFTYYMKKSGHPWRPVPVLGTVTHAIAIGMSFAAR